MSKMNFAFIGLGLLVMSLAPSNISAAKPSTSGVIGQVFIGPICPVVTPDRDCSDRPFQTTISVYSETGRFITEFMTTIDGRFQITLKPGYYFLVPAGAGSPSYPSVGVMEVLVEKKEFTTVIITYDSGIR